MNDVVPAGLLSYLDGLGETELTDLLRRRPDATLPPVPDSLRQLAARLLSPQSVTGAVSSLTLAECQLAEAAAALGDGWTLPRLAALLGVPPDNPELAAATDRLVQIGLVWPDGNGLSGRHLAAIWNFPLDLGPPAGELLDRVVLPELRRIADTLSLTSTGRKPALVARIATWLADPDNVVRLVASAPADVPRRLGELATRPAPRYAIFFGSPSEPLPWATRRGLLISSDYSHTEQMPREVAIALRGADYVAPFDAEPPTLSTSAISPDAVDREASAAVATTLSAVTAIAEAIAQDPIPLLKNGTVGIRAMRTLAKRLALDEHRVRLTIELLGSSGLTLPSDAKMSLDPDYAQHVTAEPGDQLLTIIEAWLSLPASPFATGRESEPALYWAAEDEAILPVLRLMVFRLLTESLPADTATTAKAVTERLRWYRPVIADLVADELEPLVEGLWREAHAIGLLAFDALTSLGRRIGTGDPDRLRDQAAAATPEPQHTAVFHTDLTVIVPGIPAPTVLTLLDAVADPESRSGAWTWRFSPDSLQRALDTGHTPDELRTQLTEIATEHRLPQALTYLIGDVARQYGRIQVRATGCCLSIDDEALLAEVLATKRLRSLSLHRIAPTILISAQPPEETLSALRKAGYAPREAAIDGGPVLRLAQAIPGEPPVTSPDTPVDLSEFHGEPADPRELARRLQTP
ncbi:helicase-associated domain-containing protein [Cryptosporangium sp. NPDC051539]|uniref:helicase-associated domain-containing protein n=1 Tax=Cryptosporangium sp. NPDC051539 TaxID=3363962 RepID=UPI0037BD8362